MNVRFVINQLGLLFIVLSVVMLCIATVFFVTEGIMGHEVDPDARKALFACGGVGALIGAAVWWSTRQTAR